MKSYKLFRALGIDVKVHQTFLWLLAFYAFTGLMDGGVAGAITQAVWIIIVFGIVTLHEFGHGLAALHFGIPVLDITLMPLGGMARMAYMPRNPWQELVIAIAGPAVNFVLAGLALLLIPGRPESNPFFVINAALLLFNLVPAFPMDGGRVLRAWLASRMDYIEATRKAVKVAKYACLGLFIYGFSVGQFMVCLIAIFIYFAGKAELYSVQAQNWERRFYESSPQWKQWQEAQAANAAGHRDAPADGGDKLPLQNYERRIEELKKSGEKVQVIYSDGKVLGVLRQKD
ncbi:MAG: M50 family metallopeptidase [Planctomycetota bacterium]|nr:M50 family metallopeptidase [Planctomycetota bacterium]MDA1137332.1 M50 family metallopeptidase [Planctomycetota bacterium]